MTYTIYNGLISEHVEEALYIYQSPLGKKWEKGQLKYLKDHVFYVHVYLYWDGKPMMKRDTWYAHFPWLAAKRGIKSAINAIEQFRILPTDRLSVVVEMHGEARPYVNYAYEGDYLTCDAPQDIYVGPSEELDQIPDFDWNADREEDEWGPSRNVLRNTEAKLFQAFNSHEWISYSDLAAKIATIETPLAQNGARIYTAHSKEITLFESGAGAPDVLRLLSSPALLDFSLEQEAEGQG